MQEIIEKAWEDRNLLKESETQNAIREVIEKLDKGILRVAEPVGNDWKVNDWIKKAVILYFPIQSMQSSQEKLQRPLPTTAGICHTVCSPEC